MESNINNKVLIQLHIKIRFQYNIYIDFCKYLNDFDIKKALPEIARGVNS